MKLDQLKNPEYESIPMTTVPRYSRHISALHAMTRKINSTIAFNKVCLDSDDEDCFRNPFQNCRTTETPTYSSGSGSGSGSDSGINETATDFGGESMTTARPMIVSTERSTAMAIPSDNNLRDEMAPSARTTKEPHAPIRPTQDSGNKVDDFDNRVPVGTDRNDKPGRKKPEEPVESNKPTTVDPSPSEDPVASPGTEGRATTVRRATTTDLEIESDMTTSVASEDGTTARVEGDIDQQETTTPSNEPTGSVETDAARPIISRSTSPHCTSLLSTVLVTTYLAISTL